MITWKEALCRGEVPVMMKANSEGQLGMACSFLQVEEMYPDQEKALRAFFKGNDIFFSSHKIYFRPIIRLKQKYDQFTK